VTVYSVLEFVHVLMAIVWVGGVLVTQFYVLLASRAEDPGRKMKLFADISWIGLHVFVPAAFVLVIAGISMVLISDAWTFGQTWIWASLSVYVLSLGTGMAFIGPENGRLAALAAERGPTDPEVVRRSARLLAVFRSEALLLVVVVWMMVVKPGH
jgi:uncharacterized membrane protein